MHFHPFPDESRAYGGDSLEEEWIGVDLGGSGFRIWRVKVVGRAPLALEVAGKPVLRSWSGGGFEAVPLTEQLLELEAGCMSYTEDEACTARDRLGTVARAVSKLVAGGTGAPICVAITAPGLRTKGGRGLSVVRNGPRIPDLCARLEEALARQLGVCFASLERLVGDGIACAFGERAARDGALRDAQRAYSIAGGSGLAEAFVLDGIPCELEGVPGIQKAWQASTSDGRSFEDALSPARINARFAEQSQLRMPLSGDQRPEARAEAGDADARRLLDQVARDFADLAARRASELGALERVVVGQALARMMERPWFRARVEAEFAARPELSAVELRISELRAAPALGAVAMALDPRRRNRGEPAS